MVAVPNQTGSATRRPVSSDSGQGTVKGLWSGTLKTCDQSEDLIVEVGANGVRARLGGGAWIPVQRPDLDGNRVGGSINDPARKDHSIWLYLRSSESRLVGTKVAMRTAGPRGSSVISFWTDLGRIEAVK